MCLLVTRTGPLLWSVDRAQRVKRARDDINLPNLYISSNTDSLPVVPQYVTNLIINLVRVRAVTISANLRS